MIYSIHTAADFELSATPGTFLTVLAFIAADTQGHRAVLNRIRGGPADVTPVEKNIIWQVKRIDDISAGSSGTGTAVTPEPLDSEAIASVITAKSNFTVEPTTYNTVPILLAPTYAKHPLIAIWDNRDIGERPKCMRDQLIGLMATCLDATQPLVQASMEFQIF